MKPRTMTALLVVLLLIAVGSQIGESVYGGIVQHDTSMQEAQIHKQASQIASVAGQIKADLLDGTTASAKSSRITATESKEILVVVNAIKALDATQAENHSVSLANQTRTLNLLEEALSPKAVEASRAATRLFLACIYNRIDHDTIRTAVLAECNTLVAATAPAKGVH